MKPRIPAQAILAALWLPSLLLLFSGYGGAVVASAFFTMIILTVGYMIYFAVNVTQLSPIEKRGLFYVFVATTPHYDVVFRIYGEQRAKARRDKLESSIRTLQSIL